MMSTSISIKEIYDTMIYFKYIQYKNKMYNKIAI